MKEAGYYSYAYDNSFDAIKEHNCVFGSRVENNLDKFKAQSHAINEKGLERF